MEQKLDTVVLVMGELGLLEPRSDQHQSSGSATGAIFFSLNLKNELKYLKVFSDFL